MWCTRWFIPLLLLPLPTAPPYLLLLFLVSLIIHAKPCFYCIILLTTLFWSSCYWQPIPLDSPLHRPWSDNITTYAEALRASLGASYSKPLPIVIRAADRCWCDFASGTFFEPFNVTRWEEISIHKQKFELERQQRIEDAKEREQLNEQPKTAAPEATPRPSSPSFLKTSSKFLQSFISSPFGRSSQKSEELSKPENATDTSTASRLLRKEYDLRQYGLDLILDFGWTRET
ncbi:hypothetical protein C8J56DRAFT_917882 [Mycena floridula]|nr:hypothetical protein C8J56DRAFT_917882 [Mycena floridula]